MRKIFLLLMIFFTIAVLADPATKPTETISLYEQPDANSKVVATIEKNKPIITIFTQGDWVKVADPNNGNVGWVNNKTLAEKNTPVIYLKTYHSDDKGNKTTQQIIEFSMPTLNQEQMTKVMKDLQLQQTNMQQQMNKMLQQSIDSLNALMKDSNFPKLMPVIQPIIIAPRQQNKNVDETQKPKNK